MVTALTTAALREQAYSGPHGEAVFLAHVRQLAAACGWATYHTHDSRRSEAGFPDLVLVRERVLFRELKTATGAVSRRQREWLESLVAAGADAAVWRPGDWDEIERVLAAPRGRP